MAPYTVTPIGHVASPVVVQTDTDWGQVTARVVLEPAYRAGLRGLADFSHVIVVTLLHQAAFDPALHLLRRPRGLATMPEVGIFAQRAKDRPNPLGVTVVPQLEVTAEGLLVRGLDAIDGTPVLDVKPYYPQYDRAESPRVPEWVDRLMRDYF